MFHILIVNKTINKFKPAKLLFVDKENERFPSNEIFDEFINNSLFPFFKKQFAEGKVKQIILNEITNSKSLSILPKIKKAFSMSPAVLFQKIKQNFIKKALSTNNNIISNSNRCLHKFEEIGYKHHKIYILNDYSEYSNKKNTLYLSDISNEILFDSISLSPFFKKIIPIIENKFVNLKKYYKKNIELAKIHKPLMYITINMANSTELVKLWAYKQTGIRTVLGAEGLGQPDEQFDVVLNAALHPEIEIERWVTSSFFAKKYKNGNKKKILSSAYSKWNKYIEDLGYNIYRPPGNLRRDLKI